MESDQDFVAIPGVRVLGDVGLFLTCQVTTPNGSRTFVLSTDQVGSDSEVRNPGDRGTLKIPRWLATKLNLIALVVP
jgi:hypothetical protein